mgnify:FL=1
MTTEIPHTIIGGRPYFDKAKDREMAMRTAQLPPTVGVKPMTFNTRRTGVFTLRCAKYHLTDSLCVNSQRRFWSDKARDRIIDRSMFRLIHEDEQCVLCLRELENEL